MRRSLIYKNDNKGGIYHSTDQQVHIQRAAALAKLVFLFF